MKYTDVTVSDSIKYIGVNDYDLDLFEGQYIIPNGVAYNSYVILDDKITDNGYSGQKSLRRMA